MARPDLTAVGAAFGRAAHVALDDPPYVLEDALSITLADTELLRATELLGPDGSLLISRDDPRAKWRGTFVGRARFIEDIVGEQLDSGVGQLAILGAGLDTFAQRRADLMPRLRVFEVDEPGTQRWKQARLHALGLPVPPTLRFVPLDFESGRPWGEAIARTGFEPTRPSVIVSTGVSQYISVGAFAATLRQAAAFVPGTTFAATFVLPAGLIEADERPLRAATEARAAARGFPWISFYSPGDACALAAAAGLDDVRHVPAQELNERYFANRRDGVRAASGEHLLVARRTRA